MVISTKQWTDWIGTLDTILSEADRHQEHMFGIFLQQAIEVAEKRVAESVGVPQPDQHPSEESE